MKNNKGQALVEFILILPIVLIIIFTTLDIINLAIQKNDLENKVNDEINLVTSGKVTLYHLEHTFDENYKLTIQKNDKYINISIVKHTRWISPITKLILPNYNIEVKRVIPNEYE